MTTDAEKVLELVVFKLRDGVPREQFAAAVRAHQTTDMERDRLTTAARELDDLVRLGELHRVRARSGSAEGALRALVRVAPTLAQAN